MSFLVSGLREGVIPMLYYSELTDLYKVSEGNRRPPAQSPYHADHTEEEEESKGPIFGQKPLLSIPPLRLLCREKSYGAKRKQYRPYRPSFVLPLRFFENIDFLRNHTVSSTVLFYIFVDRSED